MAALLPRLRSGRDLATRAVALLKAETRGIEYVEIDRFLHELQAQKDFIRRAFQALSYNGIEGDYAEFGCFGAQTFRLAWAAAQLVDFPTHLWAFDSFEGLPKPLDPRDRHKDWTEGAMAMSEADFVATCLGAGMARSELTTVPGFYSDTLRGPDTTELPEHIAFAYVDCDLYSSTIDVLTFLRPRLRQGMILAFDDYHCFSDAGPSGERLAAAEVLGSDPRWRLVPYIQWGWAGMSFVVEDRGLCPAGDPW